MAAKKKDKENGVIIFDSPLAAWPGSLTLPHPDVFSRVHWQTWRDAYDRPLRASYSLMHANAYAGCDLIRAHGEWSLSVSLAEVQAWETEPAAERTKLVAWLGRTFYDYLAQVTNPKG